MNRYCYLRVLLCLLTSVSYGGGTGRVDYRLSRVPSLERPTSVYQLLSNVTDFVSSLRWILDTEGDTPSLLNSWMRDYYKADGDISNSSSLRSLMMENNVKTAVKAWGAKSTLWSHMFYAAYPNHKPHQQILQDTVLVLPIGSHRIPRSWASLESLMTSSTLPAEVILLTGVEPHPKMEELHFYDYLSTAIHTIYEPKLTAKNVRLRWGVFSPKGGPAVARWLASNITQYEYVVYSDNDDYLSPYSLFYRISLLKQRPDLDWILNSYIAVNWAEESTVEKQLSVLLRAMNLNSTSMTKTTSDALREASDINPTASREHILSFYHLNATVSYLKGSVVGWPALGYLGDEACGTIIPNARDLQIKDGLIKNAPSNPSSSLPREYDSVKIDPISASREEADLKYVDWACRVQWSLTPQYVGTCANGWGAARRVVLNSLPVTQIRFGEDALFNFIAAASGFNIHCASKFPGAAYIQYGDNYNSI